jgi:hypothetical protein
MAQQFVFLVDLHTIQVMRESFLYIIYGQPSSIHLILLGLLKKGVWNFKIWGFNGLMVHIVAFWVMVLCGLAGGYNISEEDTTPDYDLLSFPHFYVTRYFPNLHLTYTLKWRMYFPLKCWYPLTRLHGVITQKTTWKCETNLEFTCSASEFTKLCFISMIRPKIYFRYCHTTLHHGCPNIGDGTGCLIHLHLEDHFETTQKFSVDVRPFWLEFSSQRFFSTQVNTTDALFTWRSLLYPENNTTTSTSIA